MRWLYLVLGFTIGALFSGVILAIAQRSLEVWNTIANSVVTLLISSGLLYFAYKTYQLEKQQRPGRALLDVRIELEHIGDSANPWLVIENKGDEMLAGEMRVYIEPEDDQHKDQWLFDPNKLLARETILQHLKKKIPVEEWKLRLRPKEMHRYHYSVTGYHEILSQLGYHQYANHQIIFEGSYKSESVRDAPQETFLELYRVFPLWGRQDWFVISVGPEVLCHKEQSTKRENVSEELRAENWLQYIKKHKEHSQP